LRVKILFFGYFNHFTKYVAARKLSDRYSIT
jgi:hypothetical protein